MSQTRSTWNEGQVEHFVGTLLRNGVVLATAFVFIGGVLYLKRHGSETADYQLFRGEPSDLRSPVGVVGAIASNRYRGLIQLGHLLLIATPVARVALSLFVFLRQRDFIYVIVTMIVLAALMYSFIRAT